MFPRAQRVSVDGEKLPSQSSCVGWVCRTLAPDVVVEYAAVGCLMNMRLLQVHSIALNGARDSADEDHGSIRLQFLYDADMGQGVVCIPVAIEIPRVVKKHEVAWPDIRSAMQAAISAHMVIDEPDAVGLRIMMVRTVQIDAMFKEDGMGNSSTVVGNASPLAGNGSRSDQSCCGLNDGRSARQRCRQGSRVAFGGRCGLRLDW